MPFSFKSFVSFPIVYSFGSIIAINSNPLARIVGGGSLGVLLGLTNAVMSNTAEIMCSNSKLGFYSGLVLGSAAGALCYNSTNSKNQSQSIANIVATLIVGSTTYQFAKLIGSAVEQMASVSH